MQNSVTPLYFKASKSACIVTIIWTERLGRQDYNVAGAHV